MRYAELMETLPPVQVPFMPILEVLPFGIIIANRESNIVFWNKAAEEMFGYTRQEIIGKPLVGLMPDRYKQAHVAGIERYIGSHRVGGEVSSKVVGSTNLLHGLRKNSEEFPLELYVVNYHWGEGYCFFSIVQDLSKNHKVELGDLKQYLAQQPIKL